MDEQVKARLIGATVLVVIAVALVPELLSGPKRGATEAGRADGKRSVVIDLGGATSSAARLQPTAPVPAPPREAARLPTTVEAPGVVAERADSAPTASGSAATPAAETPAATVATSEPIPPPPVAANPTPAETQRVAPAAAGGSWAVQVGAFGSAEAARKLVSDLKKDGLPAYVAPLNRNGKTLHRVRVGPEATRVEADKLAAKLKGRGLPASVVSGA